MSPRSTAPPPQRGPRSGSSPQSQDPARLALFGFIVVSVARIHQLFPVLTPLRPALLTLAVALAYTFLAGRSVRWENIFSTWAGKVLVGYAATTVAASFAGISLGGSAVFLINDFSKTTVAMLIIMASLRNYRDLHFMVWAFVVSVALWVYMSFTVFETSSLGSATARLGNLYMYDANDLGVILMMGLPLTLVLMPVATGLSKLFLLATVLGTAGTVALTGSRGAMVGLAVVLIFMLFTLQQVSVVKRIVGGALFVGVLYFFAPPGYWTQMSTILEPEDDYNVTAIDGRVPIAKRGFGYFLDRPILGLGPNNFGRAEVNNPEKRALVAMEGGALRLIAPHNTYVQVLSELGIMGFGFWMVMLAKGIGEGLKIRRRIPGRWAKGDKEERFLRAMAFFLPVAWVGFAASSTFVSFAYSPPPFILLAITAGYSKLVRDRLALEGGMRGRGRGMNASGRRHLSNNGARASPGGYRTAIHGDHR